MSINVNSLLEQNLTVEYIDSNFDGIITVNNQIIKAPFTSKNDVIQPLEINNHKTTPIITKFKLINSSYTKKEPICNYYGICGGCKAQHLSSTDYKDIKINKLISALNNFNILEQQQFNTNNINYIDFSLNKRRRAIFNVKNNKIGFMAYKTNNVININNCPLLNNKINNILQILQHIVSSNNTYITQVVINCVHNQICVTLVSSHKATAQVLVMLQPLFNLHLSCIYWQHNNITEIIASNNKVFINYNNYNVEFKNNGFLQALQEAEDTMQNLVTKECLNNSTNIVDFFCGYGGYSFAIASLDHIKNIISYDINSSAINSINAVNHKKIKAHKLNLFSNPLNSNDLDSFNTDTVIINPPRIGATNQIQQIAHSKVNKVLGLYCSASALAKDINILVKKNFIINNITIIDQFTYNPHLEIFIDLARQK